MLRSVLALSILTSSVPACMVGPLICTSGDACSSQRDDNTGMVTAGLVVAAVALVALVARGASHDDPPAVAPVPPPPTVIVVRAPAAGERDEDVALQRMVMQAVISARTGHCDAVVAIGHELARRAPTYYAESFVGNPQLAACVR